MGNSLIEQTDNSARENDGEQPEAGYFPEFDDLEELDFVDPEDADGDEE